MTIMLLLFAAVLALVLINVPIAVSLGIVALVAMVASHGLASLPNLPLVAYNGATNFPLLAIPLFILAGAIMNASGISQRLIAFASSLFGWIRGGVPVRWVSRRAGARVDRGVDVLRGDFGLGRGRRRCAGLHHDPRHEGEGLPRPAGRGRYFLRRYACGDHPAVDPDDPVRGDGRDLGRATLRRRHRSRDHRRGRAGGSGVLLCLRLT